MIAPPGSERDRGSQLQILRVEEHHAEALAEFFRLIWDPKATAHSVREARAEEGRRNVAEPGVEPPTWVAIQSDRVIGYVTTIPIRLWDGTAELPAYWIKGLMVHPEFRNGPIGYLVMKAAAGQLPRTGALAVAPPALRLFKALGYRDLGALPNWIRPLAIDRILNQVDLGVLERAGAPGWARGALSLTRKARLATLGGWLGNAAFRGSAAVLRVPAAGVRTRPVDPGELPEELDRLWLSISNAFPAGVVRDAGYLLHRYRAGALHPYRWVEARRRGELRGVAMLRRPRPDADPRLAGIRIAALADLVFAPSEPAVGLALLGAAEAEARALGADAILTATPTPAITSLLRRQCYLPIQGNVRFLLRDVPGDASRFPIELNEWWITRGDGQADEVF